MEIRRVDQQQRQIVALVDTDDLSLVLVLVVERDFDPLCVVDDVVVGEDVALLIEDEAGALALLGNGAVEEVKRDGGRGDIDDGGQGLLIDGDVLLLFDVISGRGGGLGELEVAERTADGSGTSAGAGRPRGLRGGTRAQTRSLFRREWSRSKKPRE